MSGSDGVTVDRQILLQQAADWLVRLDHGPLADDERQAFQVWYQSSPEHERVWQAACQLNQDFERVPAGLAAPVLARPRVGRRAVLKALAGFGVVLPLGYAVRERHLWLADYRSDIGEQRTLVLDDGSTLILNTATALDVQFDERQRQIRLYQGEVFVATGPDAVRPLSVVTDQGRVRALGTEFSVRCLADADQVCVAKDRVVVEPASGAEPALLGDGQRCLFTASRAGQVEALAPDALAWRRGELIVDRWPLRAFLAELARYRPGLLRCDDAVANLEVSGVFLTDKSDQALEVLEAAFDLQVTRVTPYWVSVGRS